MWKRTVTMIGIIESKSIIARVLKVSTGLLAIEISYSNKCLISEKINVKQFTIVRPRVSAVNHSADKHRFFLRKIFI